MSALEEKYIKAFGNVINYNNMPLDEKIQAIQECFNTNKPKNIVLGGIEYE